MEHNKQHAQPQAEAPQPQPQPVMMQPQPGMQQPVQYVMMERSLKGVGGWLVFWLVIFALAAIGYIMQFFTGLSTLGAVGGEALRITSLIFTPILAGAFLTSAVLIGMQKKLGVLVTYITLAASALYSTITSIVTYATASAIVNEAKNSYSRYDDYSYSYSTGASSAVQQALPYLIGMILVSLVIHGLIALYFMQSKRVKQTLVN